MDSDEVVSIEVVKGGYGVSVRDPEITKQNANTKNSYKNPIVEYNFDNVSEVVAFLEEVLPKLAPEDTEATFDAAFKRAIADDTDSQMESKK